MANILVLGFEEITVTPLQRTPILVQGFQDSSKPYTAGNGYLAGVVDIEGEPIENARVMLYQESGLYVATTTTDVFGNFNFQGLRTDQEFFIVAHGPSDEWEYLVSSKRVPVEPTP